MFGGAFHSRHYGIYWGMSGTTPYTLPAYLGNAFTHVQYRMCYICLGTVFQCEFNHDVNLVIELTKFGNFGELAYTYMHLALIFNADPAMMSIW